MTKTEIKREAQTRLMDGIAKTLGYWQEGDTLITDPEAEEGYRQMTDEEVEAVATEMKKQADRLARMFGYKEAWSA